MPVIPDTWEAEAGEQLEPGKTEVAMSQDHSTALQAGDRVRLHLKKINIHRTQGNQIKRKYYFISIRSIKSKISDNIKYWQEDMEMKLLHFSRWRKTPHRELKENHLPKPVTNIHIFKNPAMQISDIQESQYVNQEAFTRMLTATL